MMDTRPGATVSFVVPVRNDAVSLDRCLRSIRANDYPQDLVTIVVADNGSTDSSAAVARSHGAIVLDLPREGLGALRNLGAAAAPSDIVAFADADHEIVRGWISEAIRALAPPHVAAVGAPYRSPTPGTWVQEFYDRASRIATAPVETEWLGSGNIAVRRTSFDAVGGFDATLRTCEDVDLCRRLRGKGWTLLNVPALESVHYGNPASLKQVFLGESWRGRDNLKVSFRPPRTWKTLASAAVSVVFALATVVGLAGLLSMSATGLKLFLAAGAVVMTGLAGRAALSLRAGFAVTDLPRLVALSAAYEFGRALALVGRADYRRRRSGATAG